MQWHHMFKRFSALTIAATLIAACNTTPQSTTGGAATSAPAAGGAATAAPAAGGAAVTIRWRTRPGDAAEQKVYEEINTALNTQLASKNIKVVYDPGVNDAQYFTKIQTELAAGTAPDIFWIGGANLADFVNTGQILDIKPLIDADTSFKLSDFYDQPIKELTRDGKIYGLPRDISTMVTYYNEDLFKAAGLPTPKDLAAQGKWDWAAMLSSAQKLTDASKQQYGLGFGNWWGPGWGYFTNAAGGGMFNADRTACNLSSPESIAGAKYAKALFDQKLVPAGDANGENLFSAGKIGMYFNGRWFTPGVRTNAKFAWDVAPMPKGKVDSSWLFWGPYLVNAKTADQKAAWEVMKALTSSDVTGKVAALGSNIPPRKDQAAVDQFLKANPPTNNQAFIDSTKYAAAEAPLWGGNYATFDGAVGKLWGQMIAGQISAEDFGKQACDQTAAAFKK